MAQNTEAAAPAPAPAAAASGGGLNKLVPIITAVNLLLMGVVLFFVARRPPVAPAAEGAEPSHAAAGAGEHGKEEHGAASAGGHGAAPGPVLKLENFVIQLRGVDQDRYVRLAFDMEVSSDADRDSVQARIPQIRDSVISYFSDRTLDELRGSEGLERTKAALMKRFDEIVPGRRIRGLYVTDFIIQ